VLDKVSTEDVGDRKGIGALKLSCNSKIKFLKFKIVEVLKPIVADQLSYT